MRGGTDSCGCFPTGRHYPGIAHLLRRPTVGIASEFDDATPWTEIPIVMIDTETTGREPSTDRVIELAIVRGQGGQVVSRNAWLINPGRPIPTESTAVHGIKDADVADKPSFTDVCSEILDDLQGAVPAAYNASFDRTFLLAEVRRAGRCAQRDVPAIRDGVAWVDPLIWARHLFATVKSRKLTEIAQLLGVQLEHAHRATADAEAALQVMYAMGKDQRVPKSYGAFIQEQLRLLRAQDEARMMWRNR
jgi:DNA polymerase-3 subunit epsilon